MSINGTWSGIYIYGGQMEGMAPTRFQAEFFLEEASSTFAGQITDADNIGDAVVTGTQIGNSIQFIKTYQATRYKNPLPIFYQGIFSEDGLRLQGSWQIERKFFGLRLRRTQGKWWMQRPHLPEITLVWPPAPQAPGV